MQYDAEIVLAFVEEIAEYLPQMRQHLNKLAAKPKDKEALEEAYRLAHTIKGSAAMLELDEISAEGRTIEQTLLPVTEKKAPFTPQMAGDLLSRVDQVERLLDRVRTEAEGEPAAPAPVGPAPLPVPPLPPPVAAFQPEAVPDFPDFPALPDMPPLGFNQGRLEPPPPPPLNAPEPGLGDFLSLPDWLDDAKPSAPLPPSMPPVQKGPSLPPLPPLPAREPLEPEPALEPPPPPPAYLYQKGGLLDFELEDLPPLPEVPLTPPVQAAPPVTPPNPAPVTPPRLAADADLMDFLLEPAELESLEEAFFPAEPTSAPAPKKKAEEELAQLFAAQKLDLDLNLFEPELEPPSPPPAPLQRLPEKAPLPFDERATVPTHPFEPLDPALADILQTDSVDYDISILQSEILTELPTNVAEFDSVPLPSEISVSDAELLNSLGNDVTDSDLLAGMPYLKGLDNDNQFKPQRQSEFDSQLQSQLQNEFQPAQEGLPPLGFGEMTAPTEAEAEQLSDFQAAEDLLAAFESDTELSSDLNPADNVWYYECDDRPLTFDDEPAAPLLSDDIPTVKAVVEPVVPTLPVESRPTVEFSALTTTDLDTLAALQSLPPLEPIPPRLGDDITPNTAQHLEAAMAAGAQDQEAATLAAFDSLRGLPSLEEPPAEEELDELDPAVAALEKEAGDLPDEFTEEELAAAGWGSDDTEMGAFFLAEGQGDLDRLTELVVEFSDPEAEKPELAAKIGQISSTLRKAAEMMDLEPISRQISVLENTAGLVQTGELPADSHSGQLFQGALAELMTLLAPYQEAAAHLFDVPGAEAAPEETEAAPLIQEEVTKPATLSPPAVTRPVAIPASDLDTELAEVFATEAEEHIQNLDTRLAALEHDPNNRELIREIRRTAHTLKGSAAMVGFNVISQTGHLMEDLLDRLYDGTLAVNDEVVDLLFVTFNAIDTMVRGLSAARPEDPQLLENLRPRYAAILSGQEAEPEGDDYAGGAIIFAPKSEPAMLAPVAPVSEPLRRISEAEMAALEAEMAAAEAEPAAVAEVSEVPTTTPQVRPTPQAPTAANLDLELAVRVPINRLDTMMNQIGELVINRTVLERRQQILSRSVDELTLSIKRLQRVTRELETRYEVELLKDEAVPAGVAPNGTAVADYPADGGPAYTGNALLDDRSEFDTLEMDRYTEFHTLSREMTETVDDLAAAMRELDVLKGDLENAVLQQARLTDDLQERVVKVRLVPVSNLTPRLYRTVRSLASLEQKDVEFVVSGEQTQIDKTIFEELGDPLLHLVRNAIDHGIELPANREAAGKPRNATLTFAARTEGSQVVIEVRDDGAGLDLPKIRQRGIERGLISAEANLSEEEISDLIFLPGFSTSDTITDISGRGVGLDVVRANIARLKGTVEVTSQPGQGTTFIIRLPSTLAITRALLVKVGGYTYAVPLSTIERTLRPELDAIEEYDERTYYRVEGATVPLLDLNQLLQVHSRQRRSTEDEEENSPRSQFTVRRERPLLLINGPERAVVRVDSMLGQQEVVVKTLGTHLKNVPGVTGATILGSGEVILILNMYELLAAATGRRSRYPVGARLPQVVSQPATRRSGTGPLSESAQRRRAPLIQVVDDSLSIRKVLSAALEKAGFRVRTSKDGQEALDMVQQVPPDLIIMDIEMPRMDGYELTALLKSRDSYRRIPIVMLTSRAGLKHRQKAEEVGADGFLIKPYREQELLQIVSALLVRAR